MADPICQTRPDRDDFLAACVAAKDARTRMWADTKDGTYPLPNDAPGYPDNVPCVPRWEQINQVRAVCNALTALMYEEDSSFEPGGGAPCEWAKIDAFQWTGSCDTSSGSTLNVDLAGTWDADTGGEGGRLGDCDMVVDKHVQELADALGALTWFIKVPAANICAGDCAGHQCDPPESGATNCGSFCTINTIWPLDNSNGDVYCGFCNCDDPVMTANLTAGAVGWTYAVRCAFLAVDYYCWDGAQWIKTDEKQCHMIWPCPDPGNLGHWKERQEVCCFIKEDNPEGGNDLTVLHNGYQAGCSGTAPYDEMAVTTTTKVADGWTAKWSAGMDQHQVSPGSDICADLGGCSADCGDYTKWPESSPGISDQLTEDPDDWSFSGCPTGWDEEAGACENGIFPCVQDFSTCYDLDEETLKVINPNFYGYVGE